MWDVVYEQVERSAGNNWSVDDIKSLYNFAKVVSQVHVNTLDDYVTAHVDLEWMAVNPKDFAFAAKIHPTLVWLKVVFILCNYFSKEGKTEACADGKKRYGTTIKKPDWERILTLPIKRLHTIEKWVESVMQTYTVEKMPYVAAETFSTAIPGFLVRVGDAILKHKDKDWKDHPFPCATLESNLRQQLKAGLHQKEISQFPPACMPEEVAPEPVERSAEPSCARELP